MRNVNSSSKSGKKVFLSLAIVLLAGALGLNWYFTNNKVSDTLTPLLGNETTTQAQQANKDKNLGEAEFVGATGTSAQESEFFANARLERQKARDSALEQLNKVLSNNSADAAAQKTASEKIAKISENITAENKIETLVKAKNVSACLAVISDEKVEVIVECKELTDALVLQIKEIVMNQTKTSYENISIIEAK